MTTNHCIHLDVPAEFSGCTICKGGVTPLREAATITRRRHDGPTKQVILDKIAAYLDLPTVVLGTGSTEPRAFLDAVADALGVETVAQSKPALCASIVAAGGGVWDLECDSTDTDSGGGSTVTVKGLLRVLQIVAEVAG